MLIGHDAFHWIVKMSMGLDLLEYRGCFVGYKLAPIGKERLSEKSASGVRVPVPTPGLRICYLALELEQEGQSRAYVFR